jgi:hypothetical protein
VFRQQAMWQAGICEPNDYYLTDVFGGRAADRATIPIVDRISPASGTAG